jgi:cytochrome b involved in lipid metabolism
VTNFIKNHPVKPAIIKEVSEKDSAKESHL